MPKKKTSVPVGIPVAENVSRSPSSFIITHGKTTYTVPTHRCDAMSTRFTCSSSVGNGACAWDQKDGTCKFSEHEKKKMQEFAKLPPDDGKRCTSVPGGLHFLQEGYGIRACRPASVASFAALVGRAVLHSIIPVAATASALKTVYDMPRDEFIRRCKEFEWSYVLYCVILKGGFYNMCGLFSTEVNDKGFHDLMMKTWGGEHGRRTTKTILGYLKEENWVSIATKAVTGMLKALVSLQTGVQQLFFNILGRGTLNLDAAIGGAKEESEYRVMITSILQLLMEPILMLVRPLWRMIERSIGTKSKDDPDVYIRRAIAIIGIAISSFMFGYAHLGANYLESYSTIAPGLCRFLSTVVAAVVYNHIYEKQGSSEAYFAHFLNNTLSSAYETRSHRAAESVQQLAEIKYMNFTFLRTEQLGFLKLLIEMVVGLKPTVENYF